MPPLDARAFLNALIILKYYLYLDNTFYAKFLSN